MKAIILSAGQGSRLLPLTADTPKCTLRLHGKSILEWQIDTLQAGGIEEVVVVTGYRADKVEKLVSRRYSPQQVRTVFNPFYDVADNLASCWIARDEMQGEFILLNGDTLFETAVLHQLLEAPAEPIVLARDHKSHYDTDDMKIVQEEGRLRAIGKKLSSESVNGESIGMIRFLPAGARLFRHAIEQCMYSAESLNRWYLSVIGQLAAEQGCVWTQSIHGLQWAEVDYPLDYKHAGELVREWSDSAQVSQKESTLSVG